MKKDIGFFFIALSFCFLLPQMVLGAKNEPIFLGYLMTWTETADTLSHGTLLAKIPAGVNMVNIAFAKPALKYPRPLDLSESGLPYSGIVLKQAISQAKKNNPNLKILLSVGGYGAIAWSELDAIAIGRVVSDLGFDGVDLDFEPKVPACVISGARVSCKSDGEMIGLVRALRQALPSGAMLSVAAWGNGAFGIGAYKNSFPRDQYTGLLINTLNDVGGLIDQVNVMSYEMQIGYSPKEALDAYRSVYKGPILLGVEVPPEGSSPHVLSIGELSSLEAFVVEEKFAGILLWSLQSKPQGVASASNPTVDMIADSICKGLRLAHCK